MTRFDEFNEHGAQYMATEFCVEISDHIEDCEQCPFTNRCGRGHNGVLDYLTEEVEEE